MSDQPVWSKEGVAVRLLRAMSKHGGVAPRRATLNAVDYAKFHEDMYGLLKGPDGLWLILDTPVACDNYQTPGTLGVVWSE